ncbi:hypothetical protein V6Z11_D11G293700 [Gossypium hirsutum]
MVSVLKESFITKNLFIYFIEAFLPYFLFSGSCTLSVSFWFSAYPVTLLTRPMPPLDEFLNKIRGWSLHCFWPQSPKQIRNDAHRMLRQN